MGALARFLLVLGNLVKNGTIKKIDQAIKFAKNEFGEVTPLIKKQIEKVFKDAKKPQVGTPAKKEATVSPIREGIETLADAKVADEGSALMDRLTKNIENAKKHGNKLTQTINEKGDLIGIENANTTEKNLGVNATLDEIKSELFEGDNIVTKETDYGLSELKK